jgi:hypothetical protein
MATDKGRMNGRGSKARANGSSMHRFRPVLGPILQIFRDFRILQDKYRTAISFSLPEVTALKSSGIKSLQCLPMKYVKSMYVLLNKIDPRSFLPEKSTKQSKNWKYTCPFLSI